MNKFYVYLLLDPTRFYLPFYIGKGCGNRWRSHLNETLEKTSNPRKYHRIQKIRKQGVEPKVMFWDKELDEGSAYDLEEFLIRRFGRKRYEVGGILENLMLEARLPGLSHCQNREAVIAKMQGRFGENNPFYGKTHTEEVKIANSLLHSGKVISENQRSLISEKLKGRSKSESHKAAIGKAQKGKPKSPKSVAKMVATRRANGTYKRKEM